MLILTTLLYCWEGGCITSTTLFVLETLIQGQWGGGGGTIYISPFNYIISNLKTPSQKFSKNCRYKGSAVTDRQQTRLAWKFSPQQMFFCYRHWADIQIQNVIKSFTWNKRMPVHKINDTHYFLVFLPNCPLNMLTMQI